MVIVDRFSKYAHFLSLSHAFTTKTMAGVFCKEEVRLHGTPILIIYDQDVILLSRYWQKLFQLSKTQLRIGTTYHPRNDVQTEVATTA